MHHVFLLGKESFNYYNFILYNIINTLLENSNNNIVYHVSTLNKPKNYALKNSNNTIFFNIKFPRFGYITYLMYDLISLVRSFWHIKKNKLSNTSIFLSTSRIGIFLPFFIRKLKKLNISLYMYCERDNIEQNIWTFFAKNILEKSEYFCVKYAKALISTNSYLEQYFFQTYKNIVPEIINLSCDLSTFDTTFDLFLKKFNIEPYDYYLLIDDFKMTNITNSIIEQFLQCDTSKKLIILSRKTSFLYKHSVVNLNFFRDNRIICINTERFIHLIPHLCTYCHAYIHSSINTIKNKNYFKHDNINLILESPLNSKINAPNTLYFNEKSFLETIKKADIINKKNAKLKDTNADIIKLVNTLEDTLTK